MDEKKNIEVELRYQPAEEQLKLLLDDSEKLYDEDSHDVYFDFPDFRLLRKGIRLRYRTVRKKYKEEEKPREAIGFFELKVGLGNKADLEIKDRKKIKEYLGKEMEGIKEFFDTGKDLEEIVMKKENKFISIVDFKTHRKEYKKEEFIIDVDEVDYGLGEDKYNMCEIESMINDENQIKDTKNKIKEFAKKYNFNTEKRVVPKGWEYLRRFNKEIFEEIYVKNIEEKEKKKALNNEIKLK